MIPSLNSYFTTTHCHNLVPYCPLIGPYVDIKASHDGTLTNFHISPELSTGSQYLLTDSF